MIPAKRDKKQRPQKVDRRDAWQRVAAVTEGRFVEGKRSAKDKVLVSHGPWDVWLDTYTVSTGQTSVTYTRVRTHFMGWRDLSLRVRKRNFLDRILESLGFSSRPPLRRALTDKYVIKGKPLPRVPSLFSGSHLGEAIMALPSLGLEIKRPGWKMRRKLGDRAGVVVCRTTGVITEHERLVGMIEVVKEALDGLMRVGEANGAPLPKTAP
jgi:hypothetical protein